MIQILVAISVVCVVALIWVTLAIAKRISASRDADRWNSEDMPSVVPQIKPYQVAQPKIRAQAFPEFKQEFVAATRVDVRIRHSEVHQSVRDISANKSWAMPPRPLKPRLLTREQAFQAIMTGGKTETGSKPPQASRHGLMQRFDQAYFNKDSGDLTDPYELPRTGTNAVSERTKRNRR